MEKVKLGEVCNLITKGTMPTSVGYKFEETAQELMNKLMNEYYNKEEEIWIMRNYYRF